jgi:hypothetical protein
MRARRIAPLLLLVAFAAAPAAAQVEGSFALAQINGQPLPSASPTETNIIIDEMALRLGTDARYTMGFRVHRDGTDSPFQAEANGTYRIEGDRLIFQPDDGSMGEPVTYRWARDGETLRLYDEQQNEFRMVRQAVAAAGEPWSPGNWNTVRVNGHNLPTPWPLHPQITLTQLSFTFTADGQATARISGSTGAEPLSEEDVARYTVAGDRLTILDEGGSVDEEFAWTIHDGTLQLVDVRGHTYTLARATGP